MRIVMPLAAISVVASALVFASAHADPGDPLTDAATEAPVITEAYEVLDTVTVNTALWSNFHLTVQECMRREGWSYALPDPPTWWAASVDENGATGEVDDPFAEVTPPDTDPSLNGIRGNNLNYFEALRGDVTTDDNGTREYIAHDGVNDPYYGVEAADTAGCEASARDEVMTPALEAFDDLAADVVSALAADIPEEALADPDEMATAVVEDPSLTAKLEDVIEDHEEVVLDASGNFGR